MSARTRDGTGPTHSKAGGHKSTILRHELCQRLLENRYKPETETLNQA